MGGKIGAIVLGVAAVGSFARAAEGQSEARDPATAQGLFEDAKRLMRLGRYAEACPKLAESQRLDPGGGTLFALGLCDEGWGKTATAWAAFNDALSEARKSGRGDRESAALDHIRALEPRLTRVRILVSEDVDGLEVRRDGERLGRAQWSTAVPVDPGKHAFEAAAPGRRTWTSTMMLERPGDAVDVTIPPLDPTSPVATMGGGPIAAATPAGTPAPSAAVVPASGATEPASGASGGRWIAPGVTLGVGVVSAAIAGVFAGMAKSQYDQASKNCPGGVCTSRDAVDQVHRAGRDADVATVLSAASGVAMATSAVLFYIAARSHGATSAGSLRVAPSVGRNGFGLGIEGGL